MARRASHQPRTKACRGTPGPWREAWRGEPRTSPAPRRAEVLRGLGAEIRPCLDAWRGDPRTSLAPAPHQGVPRCSGALARGLTRRSCLASTLGAEISAQASHQPRTKACRGAPGPWREAWRGDPALPRRLPRRSPHQPRAAWRGDPALPRRLARRSPHKPRTSARPRRGDPALPRRLARRSPRQGLPRCSVALARGLAHRCGLASTLGAEICPPAPHHGGLLKARVPFDRK